VSPDRVHGRGGVGRGPGRAPAALWDALGELVAQDTATGASTLPAARLLADRFDAAGWRVVLDQPQEASPSVIAWSGPPEPGGLLLSGHMDVVPWRDQPGWTRDPLRLAVAAGRAFGRGVADMKGALAQLAALAARLDASRLRRPLAVAITSDEEVGCLGASQLAPRLPDLLGVPLPPWGLIGEPTGGRAFRAHKGHVRMVLTTHGRGGHSSRPDLGANAIAAMAAAATAVSALAAELAAAVGKEARELFPEYPAVPFNLGEIAGGTADNMIAERCRLTLGFRPGPGDDPDRLVQLLEARLRAAAAEVAGTLLTVDEVVVTPGMTSPDRGALPDALREVLGVRDLGGAPYATDGGHLEAAGVACYVWGPGELAQAHQADESVSVAALEDGLDLLERLVLLVCG